MNVAWYVAKFDEATWQVFGWLGLTRAFLQEQKRAMGGVQMNITYKRELYAGDLLTIRSRVVEIRAKVLRLVHEMSNDATGEVVAVMDLTAVHLDALTRKSCPFAPEMLARGQALVVPQSEAGS